MKSQLIILIVLSFCVQLTSQKNISTLTSNLNASKSNINRLIYPASMVTTANAQLLLEDLEKAGSMDERAQKTWLANNFKRLGIEPAQVQQISIFSGRQYADCTICHQHCTGRCVQDPGADCICISHSEPNLRIAANTDKPLTIIFLSSAILEEAATLDLISTTISKPQRATTVKSSKSNSSD
ncbi:MAG TPA: hypothetical protein VMZ69_10015 [Saprospiraceae bacterium]|nr:hypothetical protein [Saprospiraceae bacterium]